MSRTREDAQMQEWVVVYRCCTCVCLGLERFAPRSG